jgi:DNA segregation ATPase FtsK/SpoIIIE-like protein
VAGDYLARIASNGGEFGLHLVLSTQYPQIRMLGSAELKRNVTTRLCGRVDDAGAAVNALGIADSGAETLQGYGDFLLKDLNGLSRLTVAHLQEKHVSLLLRAEVKPLDLPELDDVNNGPGNTPPPFKDDEICVALFEPVGIEKLSRNLAIGKTRATRLKEYAVRLRRRAAEMGYQCLPEND